MFSNLMVLLVPLSCTILMANTVFVNSFIECEHYVVGGWNYNFSDINNFSYTEFSVLLVVAISIHFLFNKSKKFKNLKI